jgi:hypothetical protein
VGRKNTSETDKVPTKILYSAADHFTETLIPKYSVMNTSGQHSGACLMVFKGIQKKLSNIRTNNKTKRYLSHYE